jgi:N-methylhydantoinase A
MGIRLGVDVGGTFTDLLLYDDETGEAVVAKGASTPSAPEKGVIAVVSDALPGEQVAGAQFFLHGTTVALNALLERKGAVVGLLTTDGFRDVLEIRRGQRDSMYDMLWTTPQPLVPRRLRIPVPERIRSDGTVDVPLDVASVRTAAAALEQEGVESVAIVFINAYVNPAHELAARDALVAAGFTGEISMSHEVSGEYREYERTSTTTVDAYVRPVMSDYLQKLETGLAGLGLTGECLVTRSGGGSMHFGEARARPVETVMSGPAAGVMGGVELCRELGLANAVTADVGGTSFDTCVIVDGRPPIKYEGAVANMPLQTPWVDVRSIGAGGGSIASIDPGGLLVVGPRSAGAVPGPVCYGRDGHEPTVTDAAAVLGLLAFGELAGGVVLDIDAARDALARLGEPLALDAYDAAKGVLTIANAAMADAIRLVTVEQGQDPREATLIAFGGAGPLFATLLARELDIRDIVVPNYAGNFSAWGLLGQDVTRSAALTCLRWLDEEGLEDANRVLAGLFARLEHGTTPAGAGEAVSEAGLDLRYRGQEHTLTVMPPLSGNALAAGVDEVRDLFESDHERTFGHRLTEPVEIVSVRAAVRRPLPRKRTVAKGQDGAHATSDRRAIEAYSFTRGEFMEFAVVQRSSLSGGSTCDGPAIVLDDTATTYVDADFTLGVHDSGALLLTDARPVRHAPDSLKRVTASEHDDYRG